MKPIKLYLAGNPTNAINEDLLGLNAKNRLFSYLYQSTMRGWEKQADDDFENNIILDSGAFSAWNRGAVIDIHKYIDFIHNREEYYSKLPKKWFKAVNLDVIPGKVGMTKSLTNAEKEKAAKKGLINLKIMLKEGISPIHVFHQGESFKYLDKMVELVDYIGISPANDMPTASKRAWIDSVFEYMYKNNINVDTHGFAVMSIDVLKDYPWTSCDAASWAIAAGMGIVYIPNKGFDNPDFTKASLSFTPYQISNKLDRSKLTEHKIKVIETSGYKIEELIRNNQARFITNAKFIITLEKWLNEKWKPFNEYQPTEKLF